MENRHTTTHVASVVYNELKILCGVRRNLACLLNEAKNREWNKILWSFENSETFRVYRKYMDIRANFFLSHIPATTDCNKREGSFDQFVPLDGPCSGWERNTDGEFPLLKAAFAGDYLLILSLIAAGAHVNMSTLNTRLFAVFPCIYKRYPQILCELVSAGANLFVRDANDFTIFHYAVKRDYALEFQVSLELTWHNLPLSLLKELLIYSVGRNAIGCATLLFPLFPHPDDKLKEFLKKVCDDAVILPNYPNETMQLLHQYFGLPLCSHQSSVNTALHIFDCNSIPLTDTVKEQLSYAKFLENVHQSILKYENGFVVYGSRGQSLDFVRHYLGVKGYKQVYVVDCYELTRKGDLSDWIKWVQCLLFAGSPQPEFVFFDGWEAFFLGYSEHEFDSIALDMHCNNFGRCAFGVVDDRFLRRRTERTLKFPCFTEENIINNIFVEMAQASEPRMGIIKARQEQCDI